MDPACLDRRESSSGSLGCPIRWKSGAGEHPEPVPDARGLPWLIAGEIRR
jgi:hypothetical protein